MRLSESWQIMFEDKLRKLMTFTATTAWKLRKASQQGRGRGRGRRRKKIKEE